MNRNMNPKVSLINLVWSSMLIKWAFITLSILFFSVALILAELENKAEPTGDGGMFSMPLRSRRHRADSR